MQGMTLEASAVKELASDLCVCACGVCICVYSVCVWGWVCISGMKSEGIHNNPPNFPLIGAHSIVLSFHYTGMKQAGHTHM